MNIKIYVCLYFDSITTWCVAVKTWKVRNLTVRNLFWDPWILRFHKKRSCVYWKPIHFQQILGLLLEIKQCITLTVFQFILKLLSWYHSLDHPKWWIVACEIILLIFIYLFILQFSATFEWALDLGNKFISDMQHTCMHNIQIFWCCGGIFRGRYLKGEAVIFLSILE